MSPTPRFLPLGVRVPCTKLHEAGRLPSRSSAATHTNNGHLSKFGFESQKPRLVHKRTAAHSTQPHVTLKIAHEQCEFFWLRGDPACRRHRLPLFPPCHARGKRRCQRFASSLLHQGSA